MTEPFVAEPPPKTAPKRRKPRRKAPPPPAIGALVNYVGKSGATLARGAALRVVAEARNKRFIVEAMMLDGRVVRRTVAASSLVERMPDLFSDLESEAPLPSSIRHRR